MTWGLIRGNSVEIRCDYSGCHNRTTARIPLGSEARFRVPEHEGWVLVEQSDPDDQRTQTHYCPEHAREAR